MTRYIVGDPTTREPHPESEVFDSATAACLWILKHDLPYTWWPIPTEPDAQPTRLEGPQ